jgi:hypothetical protein
MDCLVFDFEVEPSPQQNQWLSFVGSNHPQPIAVGITCACRKSNPDILVVQPAENWTAKNLPSPFDGARERRILLQG